MKTKLLLTSVAALMVAPLSVQADETKITTKGGLKVKSGDYSFALGGRIQYDYNKAEKNDVTDEDGFNRRRARIYVKGNIGTDWAFKSQFNVDGSGAEDLYIRYKGFGKAANVTIGNQRVPFGLEDITSSNDISILERSGITELFAVGREESVQLHGKLGSNSTYAFNIFSSDVLETEEGEEIGFSTRYTIAPINEKGSVLHLGAAYRDIEDNKAFGLEAAAVAGPFHIQAEYFDGEFGSDVTVEDPATGEEVLTGARSVADKDGYYIQAGYILTGESRPYKGGKFKRVKPAGDGGAWEVVVRYEDGDGNHSDIELGRDDAKAFALGLNWYANKNVRLGVNYTDGESNTDNDEGNEFRVRFQLTF